MTRASYATRPPPSNTASYRAAAHIHKVGPLTQEALFAAVSCGTKLAHRRHMIESALLIGWLVESRELIGLGDLAKSHFDDIELPKAPEGRKAERRTVIPVYERPALSKKYLTNSRGNRADVPEFSVRTAPSFRSVPTGGQS